MIIDLVFSSPHRKADVRRLSLVGPGEVTGEAFAGDENWPVRCNATHGLLVVTLAPTDDPEALVRWIGRPPLTTQWQTLPCRWNHSNQSWMCAVRQSQP